MEFDALPPAALTSLSRASAYPDDPSRAAGVEHVQTHISHVFLTGARVYKLRKPVELGFVSFGSLEQRNADCLRELELNRRLAPDVYLGVAPLLPEPDGTTGMHMGPIADGLADAGCEHLVVMRRLPAGRDALSLLLAGDLQEHHLEVTADRVAEFHRRNPLPDDVRIAPDDWVPRVSKPVEDCFEPIQPLVGKTVSAEEFERVRSLARAHLDARADAIRARGVAGRWVEGHGDLHLQHVWFEHEDEPLVIDCIEFSDRLRRIDAAAEVAFLAMDLAYRGAGALAAHFLARYASRSDDYDLYSVVDYYQGYRALVRAKVAAIAARDSAIEAEQRSSAEQSARSHLLFAEPLFSERAPGRLILLCGMVGSGKSSAARELAKELEAVSLGSDPLRKRLAGMTEAARSFQGESRGLYTPERRTRVYEELLERAAPVLGSGRSVILDATFEARERRAQARERAARLGVETLLVETRCNPEETLARLKRRAEQAADASDAGPEQLDASRARFEPPDEWPEDRHIVVHSDQAGWQQRLRERVVAPGPGRNR